MQSSNSRSKTRMFTVRNTPPTLGQTAKEHGGEVLAAGNWKFLHGDGSLDFRGTR